MYAVLAVCGTGSGTLARSARDIVLYLGQDQGTIHGALARVFVPSK